MKINQNGFAAIGIILTVVVVLIIGGAGVWYFNQTVKTKSAPAVSQGIDQQKLAEQTNQQSAQNSPVNPVATQTQKPDASATSSEKIVNQPQSASSIETRGLDAKEYLLTYKGSDLFNADGPMMVKEILNCSLPDLSTECPSPDFIGKEDCDKVTHAPSDCVYKGVVVKNGSACLYEGFSSFSAGTIVTGYYGLAVRDNKCFLIGWELVHYNCDNYANPANCRAEEAQRVFNNKQMLSDFELR